MGTQKEVFHPDAGWVTIQGIKNKGLGFHFDPEYGDWVAPTREEDHEPVAGRKSWRERNPLTPQEDLAAGGTNKWEDEKVNPLIPQEDPVVKKEIVTNKTSSDPLIHTEKTDWRIKNPLTPEDGDCEGIEFVPMFKK